MDTDTPEALVYDPIDDIARAITQAAATTPTGREPTPSRYSYLRSQLAARYGPPIASAIGRLEQLTHESIQAQYHLTSALRMTAAQDDVELASLAHELVAEPAGGALPERRPIAAPPTRVQKLVFPISILLMAAVLVGVLDRYGDLGFSGNGDLYDILQLGLLPGFVALIPIWLIFRRKDNGRISRIIYAGLLFTFIVVVGLGYIYQWPWIIHPRDDTGHPATLWDWLGVALLPFVVPIAGALAGAEPHPTDTALRSQAGRSTPAGTSTKGSPWRQRARAALPFSPALLSLILLLTISVASILTPPSAHAEPAPAAPPPSEPAPIITQMVSVPSTNQWTFTSIHLTHGQHLTVTAAGTLSFEPGGPLVDPNGATDLHPGRCVLQGADHHAALIGRIVGTDLAPPFLIGANYDQTVPNDGMLALGINDLGVDNNTGSFAAMIRVSS